MPTIKAVPKTPSSHASTSTSYLKPSHAHSNALPPLRDLTGEIKRQSQIAQRGGGFADVHKALWGKENVAVKVLRWNLDDENDRLKKKKRLHREIRVWQRLEHHNILPLYGITQDFGLYPSMVCPWLEQGDLNKYLTHKHDTLLLSHRFQLVAYVMGLRIVGAYISPSKFPLTWVTVHKSSVVHGDLTGSNVLIAADGTPRLADFGLSKVMAEFEGTSYMTGTGGAVRWAAFELYHVYGDDEEPHSALISTKSDIYSFGSIMLQMLSGKVPYHYVRAQAAVVILVHSGTLPRRPKRVQGLNDDRVWEFINRCWSSPAQRPTIAKVSTFVRDYHARLVSNPVAPDSPWYDQDSVEDETGELLVYHMSPITTLRDDYGPKHPFNSQIGWLIDNGQDHLRRMRVDGDSFYRSVAFAFVEKILHAQDLRQEVKRAVYVLDSTRFLLEVAGFQPSLYEDSLVIFKSIVQQIVTPDINGETMTPEILLEAFQHPEVSNSVVLFFRLLTAAQIRAEPESYIPYLIDLQLEPMQFCEQYIQEMDIPADEVQIAALSRALGVTVEVGQLQDHSVPEGKVKFVAYQGMRAVQDSNPIVLLNRAGHYELLYASF